MPKIEQEKTDREKPHGRLKNSLSRRSVDRVFQSLTGFEFRLVRSRDLDRRAGLRVATGRSLTAADREIAEANNTDIATGFQLAGDGVENTIYGFSSIGFRQACRFSNGGDKIVLIHWEPPYVLGLKKLEWVL